LIASSFYALLLFTGILIYYEKYIKQENIKCK